MTEILKFAPLRGSFDEVAAFFAKRLNVPVSTAEQRMLDGLSEGWLQWQPSLFEPGALCLTLIQ